MNELGSGVGIAALAQVLALVLEQVLACRAKAVGIAAGMSEPRRQTAKA